MKECSIEGCERRHHARTWCKMHWKRWRKHGDPLRRRAVRQVSDEPQVGRKGGVTGIRRYKTPAESFEARTEPLAWSGCLVWTGYVNNDGYGRMTTGGRKVYAHRYAWEQVHGPIPDGRVIDHQCFTPSCCNVDHLRLATHQQNAQNKSGANSGRDLPRGVSRSGRGYRTQVKHGGVRHYLGTFPTIEAASAAAAAKRSELFGEFAGV